MVLLVVLQGLEDGEVVGVVAVVETAGGGGRWGIGWRWEGRDSSGGEEDVG